MGRRRVVAMVTMVVLVVLLVSCRVAAAPSEGVLDFTGRASHGLGALFDSSSQKDARDVSAPDVTLPELGTLRGSTTTSSKQQRTIYQYLGVPFAKAPVGELRFKEPAPVEPWTDTLDASRPGKACIQMASRAFTHSLMATRMIRAPPPEDEQSEDCLLLNVFSPRIDSAAKLPVLVFLHGGSFILGSARDKPPNHLLDYDMILVTPQYRLGPLGFLNLQEDAVPGNAGLLDVLAALQWVRDNIHSFGGDPQRVTLGGHSAGAALASLAYLSPLSRGLLHGVMPMSGSPIAFWSWERRPEVSAAAIATLLGCDFSAARVSCLRSATPAAIKEAFIQYGATTLYDGIGIGMSGGSPSVQKAGKIVLPDLPENILRNKQFSAVPLLTGFTKHEGTLGMSILQRGYIKPHNFQNNGSFFEYDLIHVALGLLKEDDPAGFVADSAMGYFFDPPSLGNPSAMSDGLIDLYGAYSFKSPCRSFVQYNSEAGQPTYMYSFSQYGPGTHTFIGIYHGAEQTYLFPDGQTPPLNGNDVSMSKVMLDFVTNFVTYQTPTPPGSAVPNLPQWEPYQRGAEHYMELAEPSVLQRGFSQELTVTRREHFSESNSASSTDDPATPPLTALPTQAASGATTSVSLAFVALSALTAIRWQWQLL